LSKDLVFKSVWPKLLDTYYTSLEADKWRS